MDIREAMLQRHSVRAYDDQPITGEDLDKLEALISACNAESGLHIQLVTDEPQAFQSRLARYGHFSGVRNYIVMVGRRQMKDLDEVCGYFGEKIVLEAQQMGLRTCWVGATYKKIPEAFEVNDDEKLVIVIAIGYGLDDGTEHRTKKAGLLSNVNADSPTWFKNGVRAAMLAPTAMNQQKFHLTLEWDKVSAKAGLGPYAKVDLGIVKYHFEKGSGKDPEIWA